MKHIYLGGFPPPYGGVTIKNNLIFYELKKYIDIKQSSYFTETYKFNRLLRIIGELFIGDNNFVIGLSNGSLIKLTQILTLLKRNVMSKSIVMVMGGTLHNNIKDNERLIKCFSNYKMIYVETDSMKNTLNYSGLTNVGVFPNCRKKVTENIDCIKKNEKKLKCVFFSLISKDKGADIVIELAKMLEQDNIDCAIDFYGHIDSDYLDEFNESIKQYQSINYRGIFKPSAQNDVYSKLMLYDVLLFPTRWKNEGVPGILVETKFAGVPSIVSDINYNAEIINNGVDGIVMNENNAINLYNAISKLYLDRDLLTKMKYSAKADSVKYSIDAYIKTILNDITYGRN